VQGRGKRNNCFIATDDNAAISENNRFKNGNLLFCHSLFILCTMINYIDVYKDKTFQTIHFLYTLLINTEISKINGVD
jgi:hypothetical protein